MDLFWSLIRWVVEILSWGVILYIVVSFLPDLRSLPYVGRIMSFYDNLFSPIRKVIPMLRIGTLALDFAPLLFMLILHFAMQLLYRYF